MDIRLLLSVWLLYFYNPFDKSLYFSPYLRFHGGTLIITLLRIDITCYIRFVFVRNEFISFLEIIALQGLEMNAL
jgi:hypothetical protein